MYHDINVRSRLPMTLQDMFLVPEEFELPSISLKKYIDLNAPFIQTLAKRICISIFIVLKWIWM